MPSSLHTAYRPDIDGLRAIAVLSVVGFHAFPGWVRGGFVGVDVFFVISGYLISGLILKALATGNFSFAHFYSRRVRRIFPALVIVCGASYLFGWFALFPDEYKQLGKHIAGGAGFVSNLILQGESGYFDNIAETKPLLHLWSLGIEEQFYLLWPLFLYIAWKRKLSLLHTMVLIMAASFLLNVIVVYRDAADAFYSPATRFWELLTGSILALVTSSGHAAGGNPAGHRSNALALGGLVLIGAPTLFLTEKAAFPGWWALLPTVGALLIIAAGSTAWLNRKVLSHPVMVWIGLISFPLYLWHWPVLSFAHIVTSNVVTREMRVVAIIASFLLAWLTYRLVEQPLRFGQGNNIKVAGLALSMLLVGALGYGTFLQDGLALRASIRDVPQKAGALLADAPPTKFASCPQALKASSPPLTFCHRSTNAAPSFAIFGDSHANHIFYGIAKRDKEHSWLLAGYSSCPPVSGINVIGRKGDQCERSSENIIRFLDEDPGIRTVVMSFYGNYFLDTSYAADHVATGTGPQAVEIRSDKFPTHNKEQLFYLGLEEAVHSLEAHGKQVIMVVDIPELPFFPRDCLARPMFESHVKECHLSRTAALARQQKLRKMLRKLMAKHPHMRLYDPINLLCDTKECHFDNKNTLFYRDSNHLSLPGSDLFAQGFLNWMAQSPGLLAIRPRIVQ